MNTNKRKWGILGIVACCLLLVGNAYAKRAELDLYPCVKHLAVENDVEHAIGSFVLDSDIFEKVSDDFSDMRVVDDAGIEIPFLIRAETGGRSTVSNRVVDFSVRVDGNHTIIEFVARREPVTGIRVFASSQNFSRSVRIEGCDMSDGSFREQMRGTYSHITAGGGRRDGRTMQMRSPTRCATWRITIDNQDNPELIITGITLIEKSYEAVFVKANPGAYRQFYGGGAAKLPSYDVGAIIASGRGAPVAYRLSNEIDNDQYNKSAWHLRIGGRVVLTIAILLMVAALGWGIVVASKQI